MEEIRAHHTTNILHSKMPICIHVPSIMFRVVDFDNEKFNNCIFDISWVKQIIFVGFLFFDHFYRASYSRYFTSIPE